MNDKTRPGNTQGVFADMLQTFEDYLSEEGVLLTGLGLTS